MTCFYEVLGVEKTSSNAEIKKAFKKLSSVCHPDKPTGNHELFVKINDAYNALKDDESRKFYDVCGKKMPDNEQIIYNAKQFIEELFNVLIDKFSTASFVPQAFVNEAKECVKTRSINIQKDIILNSTTKYCLNRLREKVKTKDGYPNMVDEIIEQKIADIDKKLLLLKKEIESVELMPDILENYFIKQDSFLLGGLVTLATRGDDFSGTVNVDVSIP